MGINRRDFVKLCTGTVAGLGVSQVFSTAGNDALAAPTDSEQVSTQFLQQNDVSDEPINMPTIQAKKNADGNYNVLFIVVDQEHYFSEYPEGTNYQARELLAKLGTTFEKHYNCANVSTSSRSVMYTGQHIPHTKMLDNTDLDWQAPLSTDIPTLGDMLGDAGYYSAYKGKFHMGDGSIFATNKADQLTDLTEYGFHDWDVEGDYIGTALEGYNEDSKITSDTLEWLTKKGKPLNQSGKSFFLSVNLINPHDVMYYTADGYKSPMVTLSKEPNDARYQKTYAHALPATLHQDLSSTTLPAALSAFKSIWEEIAGSVSSDESWRKLRNFYYNSIQETDYCLKKILQHLTDNNMLDNTIIVFTADHGEMEGEHNLKGKGGFIYENNVHVPLIIVHPEHKGGQKIAALTSHLDLAPTLVDMASLSNTKKDTITEGLSGKSLMPLMDGSTKSVRESALFCFEMFSLVGKQHKDENGAMVYDAGGRGFVRAVFTDRYKFARYFACKNFNTPTTLEALLKDNDIELYDLQNDPLETNNLAADTKNNEKLILKMNDMLNQIIAQEIGKDDGSAFQEMMQTYVAKLQKIVQ